MIVENRFNNQKSVNFSRDKNFRPELQGLFSKADMIGFTKYVVNYSKGKCQDKVMVLTNVGILMIETAKVSIFS